MEWHQDGIADRLEHIRKNAAVVRELRIVDYGQPMYCSAYLKEGDRPPDPFDLTPALALIEALDIFDRVISVVFEPTNMFHLLARLPDELWMWLSRCKPGKVSFDAYFAFPDSLEWSPQAPVGSMYLVMNEEASRVLEVSRDSALSAVVFGRTQLILQ